MSLLRLSLKKQGEGTKGWLGRVQIETTWVRKMKGTLSGIQWDITNGGVT